MKIITEKQTEFTYTFVIVLIVSLSIMRQVGISKLQRIDKKKGGY
jgi:hypothetical protein